MFLTPVGERASVLDRVAARRRAYSVRGRVLSAGVLGRACVQPVPRVHTQRPPAVRHQPWRSVITTRWRVPMRLHTQPSC